MFIALMLGSGCAPAGRHVDALRSKNVAPTERDQRGTHGYKHAAPLEQSPVIQT
jgi:hypothetical protein